MDKYEALERAMFEEPGYSWTYYTTRVGTPCLSILYDPEDEAPQGWTWRLEEVD